LKYLRKMPSASMINRIRDNGIRRNAF
jgi:hypothetical protein